MVCRFLKKQWWKYSGKPSYSPRVLRIHHFVSFNFNYIQISYNLFFKEYFLFKYNREVINFCLQSTIACTTCRMVNFFFFFAKYFHPCRFTIITKIQILEKIFQSKLKPEDLLNFARQVATGMVSQK